MPKPANEGPVEQFRQVTAAALRAVARVPELTVAFAAEPANLRGTEAHLPQPARDLPAGEVAIVRGEADSIALKLRHHDAGVHAKRQPQGAMGRAIYDAVEQARCEALGARRMAGDISTVMSPRTVITWAENARIFGDVGFAFRVTFLNKCDEVERQTVAEYYQRCFGAELPGGAALAVRKAG